MGDVGGDGHAGPSWAMWAATAMQARHGPCGPRPAWSRAVAQRPRLTHRVGHADANHGAAAGGTRAPGRPLCAQPYFCGIQALAKELLPSV
jgi:hypothetical protein